MKNKSLFIDAPTGIGGDMLLSAFLDLGVPLELIEKTLEPLGLDENFNFSVQEERSFGIRGKTIKIDGLPENSTSVTFNEIKLVIEKSPWRLSLKNKVMSVFQALADSEASVHGTKAADVHFHEIGGLDALVDVVSICTSFEYLNPTHIYCSPLPAGSGNVATAHGILPVPVPVVVELAKRYNVSLVGGEDYPKGELTTPTGLALIAIFTDSFSQPNSFHIEEIGIGLGTRNLGRPNFVRICSISDSVQCKSNLDTGDTHWQDLVIQEAWIDDASPEDIASLADELRTSGAIEVVTYSVQLKKGRNGFCLHAMVKPNQAEELRSIWFAKGSTIGLRERSGGRWVLPRRRGTCLTRFGPVNVKQVRRPDGKLTIKPEHDDLIRVSNSTGESISEIRRELIATLDSFIPNEHWTC